MKEGSTDWLRLRWRACFLRVVSDTERLIPEVLRPGPGASGGADILSTDLSDLSDLSSSSVSSSQLSSPRMTSGSYIIIIIIRTHRSRPFTKDSSKQRIF